MSTGLENDLLGDAFAIDDTPEEQEEERLYDFYAGNEGVESAADGTSYLWNQEGYSQATEADLRDYFDSAVNLQDTFGDFETYLAYMNERQDLIDSGEYAVGDYGQLVETGGLSYQDPYGFEISADDYNNLSPNDFMAKYGVDKSEVEVIQADTTTGRKDGYNEWLNSDPVQELNAKYGIDNVRQTDDGREYMWNGSGWVKTKEPENFDFGSLLKTVAAVGMSTLLTPAIAGALTGVMGAAAANGVASAIVSSALGLAQGENVSIGDALRSAASGYLSEVGMEALEGVFNNAGELGGEISEELSNSLEIIRENNPERYLEIISEGGLLEQATSGSISVSDFLEDIASIAGNEVIEIVWDATDNDGEDAAEGEVNEEGDFVFEGGDVPVTVPDYSQDEEEDGGGGASDSGGDASGGEDGSPSDTTDEPWGWVFDEVTGEWNPVYSEEEAINLPGNPDISVGPDRPGEDYYGEAVDDGVVSDDAEQPSEESEEITDIIFPDFGQDGDFTFGGGSSAGGSVGNDVIDDGTTETDDTTETGEDDGTNEEGNSNDGVTGDGTTGDGVDGDGDDGTGEGDGGDGTGDGTGTELPEPAGMFSGGSFDPKVTDLFKYTRLTPYQKQVLEPLKQQISTVKGMLS